jgi:sugar (pentulose or hexulose) kinase
VAWWASAPEYVWFRLTGERRVGVSIAAGSGLLDQLTLQWDGELLHAIDVRPDQLSDIALHATHLNRRRSPDGALGMATP